MHHAITLEGAEPRDVRKGVLVAVKAPSPGEARKRATRPARPPAPKAKRR